MSSTNLPGPANQSLPGSAQTAGKFQTTIKTVGQPLKYGTRVTSSNPCAFLIMVDQSWSMTETITDNRGREKSKAEHVAMMINEFIGEIILTCQRSDGMKNYFEILLLGYGQEDEEENSIVDILWEGPLKGKTWVTVDELKKGALRSETITKPNPSPYGKPMLEQVVQVWLEPRGEGVTPMNTAIRRAVELLEDWVDDHPDSFPPMVFNITDGLLTDVNYFEELLESAEMLKKVRTADGEVLFFNCLLDEAGDQQTFPYVTDGHLYKDNDYHRALFECSSVIPSNLKHAIGRPLERSDDVKGVILEANIDTVIRFLKIGTYTLKSNVI